MAAGIPFKMDCRSPELIGNLCRFRDVFTRDEYEFIPGPFYTTFTIGPVLIALVESHRGLPRRPLDDQENLRGLPLTFDLFNTGRASQVASAVPFDKFRYVSDVRRDPALVSDVNFRTE